MKLEHINNSISHQNTESADISASDFYNLVYSIGSRLLLEKEDTNDIDSLGVD